MESDTGVERRIASWRCELLARGMANEVVEELEAHLRETLESCREQDPASEQGCDAALRRLGSVAELASEFQKNGRHTNPHPRRTTSLMNKSLLQSAYFRRTLRYAAIILALVLVCRQFVATAMVVKTSAATPEIPQGSRIIVYRLASKLSPNDMPVVRLNGQNIIGRVNSVQPDGTLHLTRSGREAIVAPRGSVVGRVVVNTR